MLTPSQGDWIDGKGFHGPNDSNPTRDLGILDTLAFLPAEDLPKHCPFVPARWRLGTVRDHFDRVASPGGKRGRLYKGSRVLFTDGLCEDYSVRASFTQRPFAFQSSVGAIGGPRRTLTC